ncbi:LysM peptidoglycan-binding domain-containing protein, partial [Porphyromonas endodontalis]|uniref:LysM peptidoglycan-binding domain-containing protein n=1 Tax=Porphyromonas endodontalis TaxID=28124 RepID=UPI003C7E12BC
QNVEKVRLGKMTSASGELLASDGEGKEGETTEVDKHVVASAKTTTYTIRKGDTLAGIAQKHGITMDQLMQANNIKNTNYKLVPGKKLTIPVKDASSKVTKTKATRKTKKKPRRRRR